MTDIKVGDIVLRDGRAEEVGHITLTRQYIPLGWSDHHAPLPYEAQATRIGSTREGWRIHTGDTRPAELAGDARVDCVFGPDKWEPKPLIVTGCSGGHEQWDQCLAYRLRRADEPQGQSQPISLEEDRVLAPAQPTPEHTITPAELQRVAEDMRATAGRTTSEFWRRDLTRWADRISPREPEPLKVGDHVRSKVSGVDGFLLWIGEKRSLVQIGGSQDDAQLCDLKLLERT